VEVIRRRAIAYVTNAMVKDAERHCVDLELRSPKRDAERNFINGLQVAFKNITGRDPPMTARKYEQPANGTEGYSPFVELTQKCLDRLGADNASAAEVINSLGRRKAAVTQKREETRHLQAFLEALFFPKP
jgi:hypothetical protein